MSEDAPLEVASKAGSLSRPVHSRSDLLSRGLHEAAGLLKSRAVNDRERTGPIRTALGICNKCARTGELVLAGCVCPDCRDALDRNWAGSTVTDWVLVAFQGPEPPRQDGIYSRSDLFSCAWEGLSEGWITPEQLQEDPSWRPVVYVFVGATYEEIKGRWARCDPPEELCVGPLTIDEFAQYTKEGQYDDETYHPYYPSPWLQGRTALGNVVPYIRPATAQDLRRRPVR